MDMEEANWNVCLFMCQKLNALIMTYEAINFFRSES